MMKPIRKAVFPVGGLATRFLPATKAMPKEMMPIVDRPIIQHVVDEAMAGGIEHFIFVTGRNKGVIEDHFDKQVELELTLRQRNKEIELQRLETDLPLPGQTSFTRQQAPLGLGHAVYCARALVGDEPFALLLPDVIVRADTPCLAQMITAYQQVGGNIVAVEEVAWSEVEKYGIVDIDGADGALRRIRRMVEKPTRNEAPSNLMIMGRYILQPEIFALLADQAAGKGGEIQLTDGMQTLMKTQDFHAFSYRGTSHDCGNKLGFLLANIAFGLEQEELREPLVKGLREMLETRAKND